MFSRCVGNKTWLNKEKKLIASNFVCVYIYIYIHIHTRTLYYVNEWMNDVKHLKKERVT